MVALRPLGTVILRPPSQPDARVTAILTKPARRGPMTERGAVQVVARRGLESDCHARPTGPRQVLVVRAEDLETHGVSAEQVGANVVVSGLAATELTSGRVVRLGADARIRLTHACEVCHVLRESVSAEAFRALPGHRGMLGVCLTGGRVLVGARATVTGERYPEVPAGVYERFAWVVARIPGGTAVTYATLLELVGAPRAYARVLPTYVRRADAAGLPAHRVLTSAGAPTGQVPAQATRLRGEGVHIAASGTLADPGDQWVGEDLFFERLGLAA